MLAGKSINYEYIVTEIKDKADETSILQQTQEYWFAPKGLSLDWQS